MKAFVIFSIMMILAGLGYAQSYDGDCVKDVSAIPDGQKILIFYKLFVDGPISVQYSTDGGSTFIAIYKTHYYIGSGGIVKAGTRKVIEWDVLEETGKDEFIQECVIFRVKSLTGDCGYEHKRNVSHPTSFHIYKPEPARKPIIAWKSPSVHFQTVYDAISYPVEAIIISDIKLTNLQCLINGISFRSPASINTNNGQVTISSVVPLTENHENLIQIVAENEAGRSVEEVIIKQEQKDTSLITPAPFGKKLALIIGISDYTYTTSLKNPKNDAVDLKNKLIALNFNVLYRPELTLDGMNAALIEYARLLPQYNVGMIFYAGHAVQIGGSNFLIPKDARLTESADIARKCINTATILKIIEDAQKVDGNELKASFIILDACRNNPFLKECPDKGLALIPDPPPNTEIWLATGPGKTVSDGVGRNSCFSGSLLECINNHPHKSLQDILMLTAQLTKEKTRSMAQPQVPVKISTLTEEVHLINP